MEENKEFEGGRLELGLKLEPMKTFTDSKSYQVNAIAEFDNGNEINHLHCWPLRAVACWR